jgi:hypothetical protein
VCWENSNGLLYNNNDYKTYQNGSVKYYKKPLYDISLLKSKAQAIDDDTLILYKSINPKDNTDFRTGKIKYEIGKDVVCPDYISNDEIECGNALHLCYSARLTQKFNVGKILKCAVKISDISVYKYNMDKVRCRMVHPLCEVDINGNEIKKR